jgi:taurine dioxygenase
MSQTLGVQQLGASLGAEIVGVDLRQELDAKTIAGIRQALLAHHVIVFRDQQLTPEDQIRFGATLGTLTEHPVFPHLDGYPPLIEIRNYGKKYSVNEHWHTDVSFTERPPAFTVLYALEMPEMGGDTQFANQCLAYENLSPAMQALLVGLRATHTGAGTAKLAGKDGSAAPSAVHPVVRGHPETGRKALYVCRAFTEGIEGLRRDEAAPLLNWLFEESTKYEYTFRHQWRPGDLVVWDNRSTLHYAIHDHADAPRLLHRATVEGEVPQ